MKYSAKQVPLPLVIEFYDTWDVKISHGHVHVSQTGAGSDFLVPLNYASIIVE